MTQSITTREVEFDDEQYEMLAASVDYEDSIHDCGHPIEESASALADPYNPEGEWRYDVGLPTRCHACTAINEKRKIYDGDNYDSARMFTATKVMRV